MSRIRIATVGYLNARPLTAHLNREKYEVVEGHPSEIAALLASREVALALVPVVAALSDPEYRIEGSLCIGAEGAVDSVFLVAETPVEEWTTVILDGVSRTSAVLAQLLLAGPLASRVPDDVCIEQGAKGVGIDAARGTVASLVIGDVARTLPERLTTRLDLAQEWSDWTGLPFVFAVWAGTSNLSHDVLEDIREAARIGLEERKEQYQGEDREYLLHRIRYDLDERSLVGLRRFAALAHREQFVGRETIEMFGPSVSRVSRPLGLDGLLGKLVDGQRLSAKDVRRVAEGASQQDLAIVAHAMARGEDDEGRVPYRLAARVLVSANPKEGHNDGENGALLKTEALELGCRRALSLGANELWLDEGQPGALSLAQWTEVVSYVSGLGSASIRALSVDGFRALARQEQRTDMDVLDQLMEAGVNGLADERVLPLDDRVRGLICPEGMGSEAWVQWMEAAFDRGLSGLASLEFGVGERPEQRVAHLEALRELQDRTGGFTSVQVVPVGADRGLSRADGVSASDYLRTVALSRLILSGIPSHRTVWLTKERRALAQVGLTAGCNAMGPVCLPDGLDAAGCATWLGEMERYILDLGLTPVRESVTTTRDPIVVRPVHPSQRSVPQ